MEAQTPTDGAMGDSATSGGAAPPPPPLSRAGGLLRPPPREMTPVFSVFMTALFFDAVVMLFLPYILTAYSDSPWGEVPRIAFLAVSMWSGLIFGLLASVVAERRGHTPWWFLAGHLGTFAALPLAANGMAEENSLMAKLIVFGLGMGGTLACFAVVRNYAPDGGNPALASNPYAPPAAPAGATRVAYRPGPLTRALGRMWHACGNIWFGISLLIAIAVAWHWGTWWEDWYGHKAAMTMFYNAWWYGLIQLAFTASLISATLRKYPWRVEQSGWIVTHVALTMLLIGSFMSYFGKKEGMMALREGETKSAFVLDTETRVQVFELEGSRRTKIWEAIATFDHNPKNTDVHQKFEVTDRGDKLFDIEVDRYYGDALPVSEKSDDGEAVLFAVDADILTPTGQSIPMELIADGSQRAIRELPGLTIGAMPLQWPAMVESLKGGRDPINVGHVVVKDADGKELVRRTIGPGARPEGKTDAPAAVALDFTIPDKGIKVEGLAWFDNFAIRTGTDVSPGLPRFPALIVKLSGEKGEERRTALAYLPDWSNADQAIGIFKDLRVYFEYLPPFPLESGELLMAYSPSTDPFWVMQKSDGERMTGELEEDDPLDLGIPLQIVPKKIYTRLNETTGWKFNKYEPERQGARLNVDGEELWLRLGGGGAALKKDDRDFAIRWWKTEEPLGFSLNLRDFHRDFYPGRREAKTFESYLWLDHPSKFKEDGDRLGVKIDMNHPLRLDGWRLFQSRFSEGGGEQTFLQVNRDPGLVVIYPACVVLLLGLVIVFTQKRHFLKALARSLKQHKATPAGVFLGSAAAVFLAFLSTLPGVIMIVVTPEGPLLGIGVILIVAGLAAETIFVNKTVSRWLTASNSKTGVAA